MKHELPYMPLWYKDFEQCQTVKLMDCSQFGAYIRLLICCWHEGSIPTDVSEVETLSTYKGKDFSKAIWNRIKVKFFEKEGRLHNKKVDELKAEIIAQKTALSEAGKRGAAIKYGYSHPTSQAIATPQARLKHPDPYPKPNNKKQKLSGTYNVGGFSVFNKKDEYTIRMEIAKTLNHSIDSEANTQNFIHVLEETESAKGVKSKFHYALGIVRKLKK